MKPKLTLYLRRDCCLCDEMKTVIRQVGAATSFDLEEIDIDTSRELQSLYGDQVPVLFIDGRKAFKYRVTAKQLGKRIGRNPAKLITVITAVLGRRQP
jgi:glutaredoxin